MERGTVGFLDSKFFSPPRFFHPREDLEIFALFYCIRHPCLPGSKIPFLRRLYDLRDEVGREDRWGLEIDYPLNMSHILVLLIIPRHPI